MKNMTLALGGALLALLSSSALAAPIVVISDDFESDTSANYTVLASADGTQTFNYDYSADGIPAAPSGAGTHGLRLTANDTAGAADASTIFNNTPVVLTPAQPNFEMTVDVYMGVTGTGGSTEFGHVGVAGDGVTKNTLFTPIDGSGHFIGFTGEGGSSSDFRHSTPSGLTNDGDSSYLNSTNTTNATGDTYQAIFTDPPYEFAGSPGNHWATLSIKKSGSALTYSFNGTPIIATTFDGSDGDLVSLGYADLFSSVANPFQSQFVIYDNLQVTTSAIPEPSSLILLGLGGLALVGRRRK